LIIAIGAANKQKKGSSKKRRKSDNEDDVKSRLLHGPSSGRPLRRCPSDLLPHLNQEERTFFSHIHSGNLDAVSLYVEVVSS